DERKKPECAVDNICIAWPSIINCMDKEISVFSGAKALDFGCGGGLFCRKLSQLGFEVTGYDESDELVKAAQLNTHNKIAITNSNATVAQNGKYDLISSIMVFPFVVEIRATISNLISVLKPNGLIAFAAFNPQFSRQLE
ncbi:MAG: methyltransferase domain-containing protein, partial [Candidatus Electrothrix sp. AR4]|nr:methyltransferase domain-containing protein [Candidatus Electrothrix sp. AR4]